VITFYGFLRIIARLGILAGVLGGLLTACAGDHPGFHPAAKLGTAARAAGFDATGARSPLGSYLAGRVAGAQRDTRSAAEFYLQALAGDPENLVLMRQSFALSVAGGRYQDAVALARRLVDHGPPSGMAQLMLVLDDIRRERYGAANKRLGEGVKSGFGALVGPLVSAWSLAGEGKAEEALAALDALDKTVAFRPFMMRHRAYLADFLGRADLAGQAYEAAFTEEGGKPLRLLISYGRHLARAGETAKAAALYDSFLERMPDNPVVVAEKERLAGKAPPGRLIDSVQAGVAEALYDTAQALARENTTAPAAHYLRLTLFVDPEFDEALLLLGDLLRRQDHDEEALRLFTRIKPASPLSWTARLESAALLDQLGRTGEAVDMLVAMSHERAGDMTVLVTLGDILRAHERYAEALVYYDEAVKRAGEIKPRHWALFYTRGITLERTGQWSRAEADFLQALKLRPEQANVLNYLGYSWIEQGVNLVRARKMIERAVELRPDDGYIIDSLGWVMYRLGDYKQAAALLERATVLRPEDPTINHHLGDAYWRVGRRLEARFQWHHAIALSTDEAEIREISAKIKHGLGAPDANDGLGDDR
jgi:tetratricopeptide (TPR) repeat protein